MPVSLEHLLSDNDIRDELSLKDAVKAGLIAYSTGLKYIREKTLPARKVGREWFILRADLDAMANPDPITVVDPSVDELSAALSDSVREWARAQAATAPPMTARDARLVAAIFRRTARVSAAEAA